MLNIEIEKIDDRPFQNPVQQVPNDPGREKAERNFRDHTHPLLFLGIKLIPD